MAEVHLSAETLAQARFSTSEFVESVAALGILLRPDPLPWHRTWRQNHVAAFEDFLRQDQCTRALSAGMFSARWMADFLTSSTGADQSPIEHDLKRIRGLTDERIRSDAAHVARLTPSVTTGTKLAARTADLIAWVWHESVKPEWTQRKQLLQADLMSRTNQLARQGWASTFDDLRIGMRWLGNGRLQYDRQDFPDIELSSGRLELIAANCRNGWVTWSEDVPGRFGIVYPATGVLADSPPTTAGLTRLLGPVRSRVFSATQHPVTTTTIAATTTLAMSTVADHLKVLTDAGVIRRRRSGREVLYWWTDAAEALHRSARDART